MRYIFRFFQTTFLLPSNDPKAMSEVLTLPVEEQGKIHLKPAKPKGRKLVETEAPTEKQPRKSVPEKKVTGTAVGGVRPKKRRYRPGTVALREIRNQQKLAHIRKAIPKAAFDRVMREVLQDRLGQRSAEGHGMRVTRGAVTSMQEGAEDYLIRLFELINQLAIHGKRVTIMKSDVRLAARILKTTNCTA